MELDRGRYKIVRRGKDGRESIMKDREISEGRNRIANFKCLLECGVASERSGSRAFI